MKALILGPPSRGRAEVFRALEGAGATVDLCRDSHWGCPGLDDACPLDARDVDVAVAVADSGGGVEAQGVVCAYRARIPIVAVGAERDDPALANVTAAVPFDGDIVDEVVGAIVDVTGHLAAVETELAAHLQTGEHVEVDVRRRGRGIAVRLTAEVDTGRVGALADRARDAIRAYDGMVDVIDVAVTLSGDGASGAVDDADDQGDGGDS